MHRIVRVVDGVGDAISTICCGQALGGAVRAVQVVVGDVGDGHGRVRGYRADGVGCGLRGAPGFDQFAARRVAAAGDQPCGVDLGGASDQATIGIVSVATDLVRRIGALGDAAFGIEDVGI